MLPLISANFFHQYLLLIIMTSITLTNRFIRFLVTQLTNALPLLHRDCVKCIFFK